MGNPFALDTPAPAPTAPATVPAPAPTPTAPAVQPAAVSNDVDPFDAPAPQQPRGPRLREMYGRLLLIIPQKLEENLVSRTFRNPDGSPVVQNRMTADIVILSGDELGQMLIAYGGKPEGVPPIPHDKTAVIPHRVNGMFISAVGLISQCREALAKKVTQGRPGMVLGRLYKGEDTGKGEPPWLLTPATDADKAIGRAYLATVDPFA